MNKVLAILKYFFATSPAGEFHFYIPLAILIGLLAIASIAQAVIYKNKKKNDFAYKRLFKNLSKRFVTFAVLFLVYILARYENIPYFSMRIWLYVIGLIGLYIAYRYIKKYVVDYPKEKVNFESAHPGKKQENKYLPNKK